MSQTLFLSIDDARAQMGLTAAIITDSLGRKWDEAKHPRDRKGRFIETGGILKLFNSFDSLDAWGTGDVLSTPDAGHVEVKITNAPNYPDWVGQIVLIEPDTVEQVKAKAHLGAPTKYAPPAVKPELKWDIPIDFPDYATLRAKLPNKNAAYAGSALTASEKVDLRNAGFALDDAAGLAPDSGEHFKAVSRAAFLMNRAGFPDHANRLLEIAGITTESYTPKASLPHMLDIPAGKAVDLKWNDADAKSKFDQLPGLDLTQSESDGQEFEIGEIYTRKMKGWGNAAGPTESMRLLSIKDPPTGLSYGVFRGDKGKIVVEPLNKDWSPAGDEHKARLLFDGEPLTDPDVEAADTASPLPDAASAQLTDILANVQEAFAGTGSDDWDAANSNVDGIEYDMAQEGYDLDEMRANLVSLIADLEQVGYGNATQNDLNKAKVLINNVKDLIEKIDDGEFDEDVPIADLTPEPELEPEAVDAGPLDTTGWTKIGGQGGSNPGGTYEAPDGKQYYVKEGKSPDHARMESVAADFYELAGVNVPKVHMADVNGETVGVASEIIPGAQKDFKSHLGDEAYLKKIQEGFAVDAWLANWDVAGLVYDNVVTDENGDPWRVDTGGALIYRAQGAPKGGAFGNVAGEIDTLRDPNMNPQNSKVFGGMTDEEIAESAKKVAAITPDQIDEIIDAKGFDVETADDLKAKLKARRIGLMQRFGLAAPEATVTNGKDWTSPEYANWNSLGPEWLKKWDEWEHGDGPGTVEGYVPKAELPPKLYHVTLPEDAGTIDKEGLKTSNYVGSEHEQILHLADSPDASFIEGLYELDPGTAVVYEVDTTGIKGIPGVDGQHHWTAVENIPPNKIKRLGAGDESAPKEELPSSPFQVLEDTGTNGDGYHASGPWGKFGAAGVMMRHIDEDGVERFLLVQRGKGVSTNQGKWQLPGGALNSKENPYQGLARETHEELGADQAYLDGMNPVGETVFDNGKGWQYTSVAVDVNDTFDITVDGHETSAAEWFTRDEVLAMRDNNELNPAFKGGVSGLLEKWDEADEDAAFGDPFVMEDDDDEGADISGFVGASPEGVTTPDLFLSPEANTALEEWTMDSEQIQDALRSGGTTPEEVDAIDEALDQSVFLNDTTLFAGEDTDVANFKVGSVIDDPGYFATSVDPDSAKPYGPLLFVINAKKGEHGLSMYDATGLDVYKEGDKEVLLPRNSKLIVTDITGNVVTVQTKSSWDKEHGSGTHVPAAVEAPPPPSPQPDTITGAPSLPGANGTPIYVGTKVMSTTDGSIGEVVAFEKNGTGVRVKMEDGKIRGRKVAKLNAIIPLEVPGYNDDVPDTHDPLDEYLYQGGSYHISKGTAKTLGEVAGEILPAEDGAFAVTDDNTGYELHVGTKHVDLYAPDGTNVTSYTRKDYADFESLADDVDAAIGNHMDLADDPEVAEQKKLDDADAAPLPITNNGSAVPNSIIGEDSDTGYKIRKIANSTYLEIPQNLNFSDAIDTYSAATDPSWEMVDGKQLYSGFVDKDGWFIAFDDDIDGRTWNLYAPDSTLSGHYSQYDLEFESESINESVDALKANKASTPNAPDTSSYTYDGGLYHQSDVPGKTLGEAAKEIDGVDSTGDFTVANDEGYEIRVTGYNVEAYAPNGDKLGTWSLDDYNISAATAMADNSIESHYGGSKFFIDPPQNATFHLGTDQPLWPWMAGNFPPSSDPSDYTVGSTLYTDDGYIVQLDATHTWNLYSPEKKLLETAEWDEGGAKLQDAMDAHVGPNDGSPPVVPKGTDTYKAPVGYMLGNGIEKVIAEGYWDGEAGIVDEHGYSAWIDTETNTWTIYGPSDEYLGQVSDLGPNKIDQINALVEEHQDSEDHGGPKIVSISPAETLGDHILEANEDGSWDGSNGWKDGQGYTAEYSPTEYSWYIFTPDHLYLGKVGAADPDLANQVDTLVDSHYGKGTGNSAVPDDSVPLADWEKELLGIPLDNDHFTDYQRSDISIKLNGLANYASALGKHDLAQELKDIRKDINDHLLTPSQANEELNKFAAKFFAHKVPGAPTIKAARDKTLADIISSLPGPNTTPPVPDKSFNIKNFNVTMKNLSKVKAWMDAEDWYVGSENINNVMDGISDQSLTEGEAHTKLSHILSDVHFFKTYNPGQAAEKEAMETLLTDTIAKLHNPGSAPKPKETWHDGVPLNDFFASPDWTGGSFVSHDGYTIEPLDDGWAWELRNPDGSILKKVFNDIDNPDALGPAIEKAINDRRAWEKANAAKSSPPTPPPPPPAVPFIAKWAYGWKQKPIFVGTKVKGASDGKEYVVVGFEPNGTGVKIKGADGKVKGRKLSMLEAIEPPPTWWTKDHPQTYAEYAAKQKASPTAVKSPPSVMVPPSVPGTTYAPKIVFKPTLEPDPNSPWFEKPQPKPPVKEDSGGVDWVPDGWIDGARATYLLKDNKQQTSLDKSSRWSIVQQVVKDGNEQALETLFIKNYIDQALFDSAKAHFAKVKVVNDAAEAKYVALREQYIKDIIDWKAANGIDTSAFPGAPKLSTDPFMGGPADWSKAHPGTPSADAVLDALRGSVPINHRGASFAGDSGDIKDLDVRGARVIWKDGSERIELKFNMTDDSGTTAASHLDAAGATSEPGMHYESVVGVDAQTGLRQYEKTGYKHTSKAPGITRTLVDPETGAIIRLTRQNTPGGSGTKNGGEIDPTPLHNEVRIFMPVNATGADIEKALKRLGIQNSAPASEDDVQRLAEDRLIWAGHEAMTDKKLAAASPAQRAAWLTAIKDKYGITPDDVVMTTNGFGRIKMVLNDKAAQKVESYTGVAAYTHNVYDGQSMNIWLSIFGDANQGLISTATRWAEGIGGTGMSQPSDMQGQGGQVTYTHVLKGTHAKPVSHGPVIVMHPRAASRRLDIHGSGSDAFGHHKAGTKIWELVSGHAHEVTFRNGIPVQDMWYAVISANWREQFLDELRARGITEINGVPIEDFFVAPGAGLPAIDPTLWTAITEPIKSVPDAAPGAPAAPAAGPAV